MESESVWNIKKSKSSGLKTFRIKWTEEYLEHGHTIVKARNEDEAIEKFSNDEYEEDEVDDKELVDNQIDEIEEIK